MVILAVRGADLPDKSQRENSPKALNPLNEGSPALPSCAPNKIADANLYHAGNRSTVGQ